MEGRGNSSIVQSVAGVQQKAIHNSMRWIAEGEWVWARELGNVPTVSW